MIEILEDEGTKVCNKIAHYSKKWKQPINISKAVVQIFHSQGGKRLSKDVLRRCFFAYSFPFFAWIFLLYLVLPKTQKELLLRKLRNGLRLVHRCPFVRATDLFQITREELLEEYVSKIHREKIRKKSKNLI